MIRPHQRRIARAFRTAIAALSAPAALAACRADETSAPEDASVSKVDSSGDDDGATPIGATPDGSDDAHGDANRDSALPGQSCWTNVVINDSGPDVEEICVYTFPCGLPPGFTSDGCDVREVDPGGVLPEAGALPCRLVEGDGCLLDAYAPGEGGSITMSCVGCAQNGSGRLPRGLVRTREVHASNVVGAYFARAAYLERASVDAFHVLAGELETMGAPADLVAMATRCAGDEVKHARVTSRLARARGGSPNRPKIRRGPKRSAASIARENKVEGCVRETFGALVASFQAAHARDPEIARALRTIARDEARHAALAWAIDAWLSPSLDADARARTRRAARRAIRELRASATIAPAHALVTQAGMPTSSEALALIASLETSLWSSFESPIR